MVSIRFLDRPPKFLFFTGKGGVGKTSLACATALRLADQGAEVLLVSTDPASNIGQVLGLTIGNHITPVTAVPGLHALEIDPEQAAASYRDRILNPVRGKLPESAIRSIEEQLSGGCTTEIAAFDEFTALMTSATTTARYRHIIFDTAPTGHTIRLLQLPGAWDRFIEANPQGASCLGPLAGLEKQRQQYHDAVQALADGSRTRLILVARAQPSSLNEVARTSGELAQLGLSQQHLAINGIMPDDGEGEPLAQAIIQREQAALKGMPTPLQQLPCDRFSLMPCNILGINPLRMMFEKLPTSVIEIGVGPTAPQLPALASLVDEIEADGHGLIMLMGKGGVGKTTMAAAIATTLAERGHPVHLTTSDPAAHLDATLDGAMPTLKISRIDPAVESARYRQEVIARKGKNLDAHGRATLEEDLRSPCTEEIAVFQAFSRIIRESGERFVIMDTAPTGHTLLLLDATGAYHREVERNMAQTDTKCITPMMRLQDPAQTKVIIVTLAETTPVLEAAALEKDLQRAGITPWAWIVNQSLAVAHPASGLLRLRAQQEIPQLQIVIEHHANRYAAVPIQMQEPIGVARLKQLCNIRQETTS